MLLYSLHIEGIGGLTDTLVQIQSAEKVNTIREHKIRLVELNFSNNGEH